MVHLHHAERGTARHASGDTSSLEAVETILIPAIHGRRQQDAHDEHEHLHHPFNTWPVTSGTLDEGVTGKLQVESNVVHVIAKELWGPRVSERCLDAPRLQRGDGQGGHDPAATMEHRRTV